MSSPAGGAPRKGGCDISQRADGGITTHGHTAAGSTVWWGHHPGAPQSKSCTKGSIETLWGTGQKLPDLLYIWSGVRLSVSPGAGSPRFPLCLWLGPCPVCTRTCRCVRCAGRWRFQSFPFPASPARQFSAAALTREPGKAVQKDSPGGETADAAVPRRQVWLL